MTQELTPQELEAEGATALPNKEVMSLLDLNANVDLGLDLAAPVDLAAAANLNLAAPIEASAAANVLSPGAEAGAAASQHGVLVQGITGTADATAPQHASVDQGGGTGTTDGTTGGTAPTGGTDTSPATTGGSTVATTPTVGDVLNGASLLDANVNIDANANLAAPIDGAVAANANVAAPVDAAVAANLISPDASATAIAPQDILIDQLVNADASATATQDASVSQS